MIRKIQNAIYRYNGKLNAQKLTGHARAASTCYDNQRRRCYCKTNPRYKDNGAKGITVEYSKRDFIGWYLYHIKLFTGENPSVGRIDHSKSYSFDNIKIESVEENSLERINRCGTTRPRRKILIIDCISNEQVFVADSGFEAERLTGVRNEHISKYCNGILKKTRNNFTFRYADDLDMDKIQSL